MRSRRVLFALVLALMAMVWSVVRRRMTPMPPWWMRSNAASDLLFGTTETLNAIGLRPGQRVLEVGPGGGRLLLPVARRVLPDGDVTGLEVRPDIAAQLRQIARVHGAMNVVVVAVDATAAHFPQESFDVVYLCAVLGEIGDREAALRQCYAALKPGGTLSVTEGLPDPHYQRYEAVQRLAEVIGFRVVSVRQGWAKYTANFVR